MKKINKIAKIVYNLVNEAFNSLNEAYQSDKLREIIKQHGKPKYNFNNKILYDLKDEDILDICQSWNEYYDKYKTGDNYWKNQDQTHIELEDGSQLVLNMDDFFSNYKFDNMRKERHKGNQGRGGDTINQKYRKKVIALEHKRNLEKILKLLTEEDKKNILSIIEDKLIPDDSELEQSGEYEVEEEVKLEAFEEPATLIINYDLYIDEDGSERYGATYTNVCNSVVGCTLYINDEEFEDEGFTDDELKLNLNSIKDYQDEIETGITNYYQYYGVNPGDFV